VGANETTLFGLYLDSRLLKQALAQARAFVSPFCRINERYRDFSPIDSRANDGNGARWLKQGVDLRGEFFLEAFRAVISGVHQAYPPRRIDDDQGGETLWAERVAQLRAAESDWQGVARFLHEVPRFFQSVTTFLNVDRPEVDF